MKKFTIFSIVAAIVLNGCSAEGDVKNTVNNFVKAANEGSYTNALNYASQDMVDNMVFSAMMASAFNRDIKCNLKMNKEISEQPNKAQECFSTMYKDYFKDFEILSTEEKGEKQYIVHYSANAKEGSYKVLNLKDKWTVVEKVKISQ